MTQHDFVVPETPEFQGNMTGDLVYAPKSAGVEALPVRLSVGRALEAHRGFGIEHLADNGKRDGRREAPQYTNDKAENYAREVAAIARDTRQIYQEVSKDRLVLRSPVLKKALIVERRERDGEAYYSVVTSVPSLHPVWGDPIWSGRLTLLWSNFHGHSDRWIIH